MCALSLVACAWRLLQAHSFRRALYIAARSPASSYSLLFSFFCTKLCRFSLCASTPLRFCASVLLSSLCAALLVLLCLSSRRCLFCIRFCFCIRLCFCAGLCSAFARRLRLLQEYGLKVVQKCPSPYNHSY